MKKKGLATGAVAMALAVSMAFMPAIAKAETVDNVDVTVTTDKTEYSSGEEVKLNVNVKNNNSYELKSPNITFQLPDGLTVDGKSTYSYDFNSISSGATTDEVVELKNVTVTDNNSQVTNPTQDSNSEITKPTEGSSSEITKPTGDSNSNVTVPTESDNLNVTNPTTGSNSEVTVPTQDSNSNVIVSTENNSDDKQAEAKAPQTGDTAKTIIYVITLLLAVSGIIFIVLKKKKIASSLLVLALIATGLAVIPSSSVKAATNKSVTGKVTVKVDAKDADINYAFTYSVDTVSDDSGSNTDTTQPSGGSSTEVTNRSEIGQKILEHKNSEEWENVKLFDIQGTDKGEQYTDEYGRVLWQYLHKINLDNQDVGDFGLMQFNIHLDLKGKFVVYNELSDKLQYICDVEKFDERFNTYYKDTDLVDVYEGDYAIPQYPFRVCDKSIFTDYIKNIYIAVLDENDNVRFSCKYMDYINYVDYPVFSHPKNNSVYSVSVEPINEENGSVSKVKLNITYKVDISGCFRAGVEVPAEDAYLRCIKLFTDNDVHILDKSVKGKEGTLSIEFTPNSNGNYYCRFDTYPMYRTEIPFTVDCLKDTTAEPIPAEKFEPATVTVSGTPDDNVPFGTPVTMKMTTDKPCTMSFNGQPVSSDYVTSGDFTVTANGTYSYVAVTEQGVPTTGTFTVDFFTGSAFNTRNDWKDPANSPLLP